MALGRLDVLRVVPIGRLAPVGLLVVLVDQVEIQTLRGPIVPATQKARLGRPLIGRPYSEDLEATSASDFFSTQGLDLVVGSQDVAGLDRDPIRPVRSVLLHDLRPVCQCRFFSHSRAD